ncbi:leucine-rich repeat domain-containing protein [Pseudoflavonifractor sp.]|jgi:hypothetical protein|uniref:leucine-rich repeat domain-containing protein n=1 Tax=Pseudoflavonifractor sp. TaxID=1980281 RepID=UPI003D8C8101
MKKRALSLLLALCLCLSLMPAASASVVESTVQVGPYTFEIWFDGTATLTRYDESLAGSTYADIPASVTGEDGQEYPVTVINDKAFEETNITGVTVPDSVITIGDNAFSYCNSLSDVRLSENLSSIGEEAFASCDALREITIPASVKEMSNPFAWCTGLDTVYMKGMVAPIFSTGSMNLNDEFGPTVFVVPQGSTGYEDWTSKPSVLAVIYEGEPIPSYGLSLSTTSLDFGTGTTLEDEVIKTVTVTNTGDRTLRVTLPDRVPNFLLSWDSEDHYNYKNKTLEPGESAPFFVVALNYRSGTYDTTVTITTEQGPSAILSLLYTVLAASIQVTADTDALDFGTVEEGYTQPAARTITYTNHDAYDVGIFLRSNSYGGFLVSDPSPYPVEAHGTATLTVQPKAGLKPGTYNWEVRVECSLGGLESVFITIPLTFTVAAEGELPAADVPSTWAVEQVNQAVAAGIVPESFQSRYTQAATRAEFCSLAVRLYEKVTGETITQRATFSDTTDFNVQKMAGLGVVNGVGGGKFDPGGTLTREQAATILARLAEAMGHPLPQADPSFSDSAAISSWAAAGVGQVQAAGIMAGDGSAFIPQSPYTREQCILTVLRLYQLTQS